jgi:DNA primase large subunit
MKPLLEKYLLLEPNSSSSSKLFAERQKDHYSHFILRLAFASTEDLRRRFSRVESMLFRLRMNDENSREKNAFIQDVNLDCEQVTEDERSRYRDELAAVSGFRKGNEEETWIKVDWERVPDLVESRRVFLKAGKAYVPSKEQSSMVIAEFTKRLDRALEVFYTTTCRNATSDLTVV